MNGAQRVGRQATSDPRAARSRRAIVVLALVGALAVVGAVIVWTGNGDGPLAVAPTNSTAAKQTTSIVPGAGAVEAFVPAASSSDGMTAVNLTLLDGSQIAVNYPANLDLTSNGLDASTVGTLDGDSRVLQIHHGTTADLIERLERNNGTGEHVETFADGRGGGVERWEFPQNRIAYLVFEFEPWTAYVWDGMPGGTNPQMGETAQEIWARTLLGSVGEGGFLVLSAEPPLQLVAAAADPGPDGPDIRIDGVDGGLGLFLNGCDRLSRLGDQVYGAPVYAFCDEPSETLFFVFADGQVQQQIDEGLSVDDLALPPSDAPVEFVVHGSDGGCGTDNMPDGWQDSATKHGPLWLWHVGPPGEGTDGADRWVKTIAILEPGAAVTLTVPDAYRSRVAHLFDASGWNTGGRYRLADGGRSVTFLPCESAPAEFVGGFVFRGELCVEFDVSVDASEEFRTAIPLGAEPCPESLTIRSPSNCPAAAPHLTGGADGLPRKGQTSAQHVTDVLEATRSALLQANAGVLDARMVERNGQVWDGPGDGTYTITHVADFQIEVLLSPDAPCPKAVQIWNGVPLLFNRADT